MSNRNLNRRQIGGSIWNSDVRNVKKSIKKSNEAVQKILNLLEKTPAMPYRAAISIYLTTISTCLTEIHTSLDSLLSTADNYRDREPDEIWREAIPDEDEE